MRKSNESESETRRRDLARQSHYYNAESGKEAAKRFIEGMAGSIDDLDNVLYYLLNQWDAEHIRARLKSAAEVHPNEVAKRLLVPDGGSEDGEDFADDTQTLPNDPKPADVPKKKQSALDMKWERLMRDVKD